MPTITIDDIHAAQQRIRPYVPPTRVEQASDDLGSDVWLKLENTNLTHSFKIRGALNAALSLDEAAKSKGLVTASSGNHAQGLAYGAHLAGVQASILMPAHTPARKVSGVRRYGAIALTDFANYDEAEAEALRMAEEDGRTFISAYNDPRIIAGTGTIGLEILTDLPDVERVVVCVGGGGLISGVAMAIKSHNPAIEVIGVCAQSAPTMYNLMNNTDHPEVWETWAEALSGGIEADALTITMTRQYVDQIVMVTEAQIANAMRWAVDAAGWLVEGGGAVGIAALLHHVIADHGKKTAVVVSGGNLDLKTLLTILDP